MRNITVYHGVFDILGAFNIQIYADRQESPGAVTLIDLPIHAASACCLPDPTVTFLAICLLVSKGYKSAHFA